MEQLEVKVTSLATIAENLDVVAADIEKQCAELATVVVTEDSIKDSKQLLADIRKNQKALDDDRKKIKKQYMKPYDDFEEKAKKVIALYNKPIEMINGQLHEFEERRIEEKKAAICGIYVKCIETEELSEWRPLNYIFNPKWTNATYKESQIEQDIRDAFATLHIAVDTVKSLGSDYEVDGLRVLQHGGDLQQAITRMNNLKASAERLEEIARQKAEQEAKKAEQEEKKAEQEAVKTEVTKDDPVEKEDAFFELETYVYFKIPESSKNDVINILRSHEIEFEVE